MIENFMSATAAATTINTPSNNFNSQIPRSSQTPSPLSAVASFTNNLINSNATVSSSSSSSSSQSQSNSSNNNNNTNNSNDLVDIDESYFNGIMNQVDVSTASASVVCR
jgi:hypothetical protein